MKNSFEISLTLHEYLKSITFPISIVGAMLSQVSIQHGRIITNALELNSPCSFESEQPASDINYLKKLEWKLTTLKYLLA